MLHVNSGWRQVKSYFHSGELVQEQGWETVAKPMCIIWSQKYIKKTNNVNIVYIRVKIKEGTDNKRVSPHFINNQTVLDVNKLLHS